MSVINTSNKDVALALASRGLRVFPCGPDKKPKVKAWEEAASANVLELIVEWDRHPDALPGLPVGLHGFVIIDADRKPSGPDGVAAFTTLCAKHEISLFETLVVETPNKGYHFYWKTDIPYGNSSGSLPDGIDVRGRGGYVIAPGSSLPDGRSYRIVQGSWDAIQPLPDTLAAFLREKHTASLLTLPSDTTLLATDREREYAQAALVDEVAKLSVMTEGSGRNAALNDAAFALGTMAGWIDLNKGAERLLAASVANGYVAKDGQAAAVNTITSGIDAGRMKPRPALNTAELNDFSDIMPMIEHGLARLKGKCSIESPLHTAGQSKVELVNMNDIQEESINWLWNGYLPKGKLTLLAGAGGTGKSTISFNLSGTVSNGGLWPDSTRCMEAGNVLIWSSEDDPADTIKPRLMAVGANTSRISMVAGVTDENGEKRPFDPARDIDGLRDVAKQMNGLSMLIIDPIVSAVTGNMDKANDVRRGLQPLVDFAAEYDCAVIGITHFAKNSHGKHTTDRVLGSQAFAAMARMVLVTAKEEESDRRVLSRDKTNIAKDGGGFPYTIETVPLHRGIIATRIVWGEALEGSSRAILSEVEGEGESIEDMTKLGQAKRFLMNTLVHQAVGAAELLKHAREGLDISEKTLRRAAKQLGIKPQHNPVFQGGWVWALPKSTPIVQ